jgi:hypothetical protein
MSHNKDKDQKAGTRHDKDGKAAAADREAAPPSERTVDKTGALTHAPAHENSWNKGAKKT